MAFPLPGPDSLAAQLDGHQMYSLGLDLESSASDLLLELRISA